MKNLSMGKKVFILFIAIIIIVLWLLIPLVFSKMVADKDLASKYSDTFNVVNALFSGLAFAGLIYTILLQQSEIEKQSAELQRSNKMTYLSTLLSFYSDEEAKYLTKDAELSRKAREQKEKIRLEIESINNTNL
jgi:hypothetical protein